MGTASFHLIGIKLTERTLVSHGIHGICKSVSCTVCKKKLLFRSASFVHAHTHFGGNEIVGVTVNEYDREARKPCRLTRLGRFKVKPTEKECSKPYERIKNSHG